MTSWRTMGLLLAVAVTLPACGDRELDVHTIPALLSAESIDQQLVFVETTRSRAVLLDVATARPSAEPRVVDLPTDHPVQRLRRARVDADAADELLVLCQGHPADEHGPSAPAALVVLDRSGVDRSYELSAGYDAMTQSDDGRYVIAFYEPSNSGRSNRSLLFNPNQIDIVDLDGDAAPRSLTLTSVGDVPRSIVFSPELPGIGGRRLAVVLMDSVVSLVDLSRSDSADKMVQLATDGRQIGLREVVFDAEESKLYLRGTTPDVYVLQLLPKDDPSDFQVSLNQLGAGAPPNDMALTTIEVESAAEPGLLQPEPRLLAVAAQALVIDADSSRVTHIPLAHSASDILLFEGTAPGDAVSRQRALLYRPGSNAVSFLDLDNVEERKGRNLETLTLPAYSGLIQLDNNVVLLLLNSGGLSLLDLADRTISVVSSSQVLTEATFDPTLDRLWLEPGGDVRIGYVDVLVDPTTGARDFRPNEVRLGGAVQHLFPMERGTPPRLAVTHPNETGAVTVLDAAEPGDLDKAVVLRGFITAAMLK